MSDGRLHTKIEQKEFYSLVASPGLQEVMQLKKDKTIHLGAIHLQKYQ